MPTRTAPRKPAERIEVLPEQRRWGLFLDGVGRAPRRRRVGCTWKGCDRLASHAVWAIVAGRRRSQHRLLCEAHTGRYEVPR